MTSSSVISLDRGTIPRAHESITEQTGSESSVIHVYTLYIYTVFVELGVDINVSHTGHS